jgi:hypothetical protein
MSKIPKKVVYTNPSKMGAGSVPVGAEGIVLKYIIHHTTTKLLVNFSPGGIVIVPLSAVEQLNI